MRPILPGLFFWSEMATDASDFEVQVNGTTIFSKKQNGRMPTSSDIIPIVNQMLS
jgi:predicted Rdx family selenoprotein